MAIDFASIGTISVGGTTVVTLNNAGTVTTPLLPSFHVQAGSGTTAPNYIIPAGTVMFNVGSCYNNTNGRFTAPIAGVYHFRYHQLLPYATTGRFDVGILVNGSLISGTRTIIQKDTASSWRDLHAEGILKLNVNDYVNVYYYTGGAALYTDGNYGVFSGYLVG